MDKIGSILIVVVLTIVSALGDSQGFIHAAKIWQAGKVTWDELGKSALGFAFGIAVYWVLLRWMKEIGIFSAELQSLIWFTATIIGVAIASGDFFKWQIVDQVITVLVILGIAWLTFRTTSG